MVFKSYGSSIIKMDTQGTSSKKLKLNELSFVVEPQNPASIPFRPFTNKIFTVEERDELKEIIREVLYGG